jgi:hypothetical protein
MTNKIIQEKLTEQQSARRLGWHGEYLDRLRLDMRATGAGGNKLFININSSTRLWLK